jgi:hypothetical protein
MQNVAASASAFRPGDEVFLNWNPQHGRVMG